MNIPALKTRFHQLCNLEFPTANDVAEVNEIGQELIAARKTAADQVVMTQELIYNRIGRLTTRWRMNNPTSESVAHEMAALSEFEAAFGRNDGSNA